MALGTQATGGSSTNASISSDGRFVAFESNATNLVSGDSNGQQDIFVYDRQTGSTMRVSVATGGTQATGGSSGDARISADGRFVAFQSAATNLVSGDSNAQRDIFVHDRQTMTTTRVSVATGGTQATGGNSITPSLSADGRFVAFESAATNLVSGDSNAAQDIFVHDRQTGSTTRASVATGGTEATGGSSFTPRISADGRFVAFQSAATNLVSGDTNALTDVFVHDRQTATTTRVSVATGGTEATGGNSINASLSADGRFVAFQSGATNLVSGDSNGQQDIFVHDRQTGSTTRVNVATGGTEATGGSSFNASISDGRFVAFDSQATNLVSGDSNAQTDIFVHDRQTGSTTRVSVATGGTQATGGNSSIPSISADARFVAFQSSAINLVPADTNAQFDIFLTANPLFASATGSPTSTTITAHTPEPSAVNQSFTVSISVTRSAGSADITGSVVVSDGQESCTATLSGSGATATGSCAMASASAGTKSLLAQYQGDANYAASSSATVLHTVTAATLTGFTTTGDSPDPSRLERTVTYSWSLTPAPIAPPEPGRAPVTPTGTVAVKEAADCGAAPVLPQHQCVATLPASSCQIAFATTGIKNTVLCYSGDSAFSAASAAESHEVTAATVPVSLAWVQSSRVSTGELAVQFATASNVGTVAFDIAAVGLGQRASRSDAGVELYGASELLASTGDSIRAARYTLRAMLPPESAQFYLRSFDADGSVESFGPFTIGTESGSDPARDSAPVDWSSAREAAANAATQNRNALRNATAARGVYLQVANAGVQQITAAQLNAAGYTALNGAPVAELAITSASDGVLRSVPIRVTSTDAQWNSGDSIQFIGTPSDTQHSGSAFYTLAQNKLLAVRIADINSTLVGTGLSVLPQIRTRAERLLFSPTSPGATPWSWLRIAATNTAVSSAVTLNLPNVQSTAGLIHLTLLGGVDHDGAELDHHIVVSLNGQNLGDIRFDGVRSFATTLAIPAGVLRAGDNTLSLRLPADTGLSSDVISLESVQIEANEALSATNGRMDVRLSTTGNSDALLESGFEDPSAQSLLQLALNGISSSADLYRVRGNSVSRITGAVLSGNALRIGLEARNGDRLIASDAAAFTPSIASVPETTAVLSGTAQYLVISHPSFLDQLGSLIAARTQAGLSTKVISTEQVYAAYSGGEVSAQAIARYLVDAKAQLGTEYVLLVGGDTLDARGYQNSGSVSFVPTLYRQTSQLVRFAPSDSALADTDQNGLQDLAIGRMPVRNAVELTQIIEKTLRPNNSTRALLVGDRAEPGLSFSDINTGLAPLLPSLQIQRAERDQLSAAQVNQSIVEHVNTGGQWLQYFGHAGPSRWSFDNVLSVSQLSSGVLTNTQPVKVLQWACWTNYFVDPTHNTLGHAWLNQARGASLVLGPGTLTETAHDEALAQKLLPLINLGVPLGKALMQAKAQLQPGMTDVQLGVGLLGDPAAQ